MSNSLIPTVYGAKEDCCYSWVSAANVKWHLAIVNSISNYLLSLAVDQVGQDIMPTCLYLALIGASAIMIE